MEPAKIFQSVAQQAWGVGWVGMVGVWREGEGGERDILFRDIKDKDFIKSCMG